MFIIILDCIALIVMIVKATNAETPELTIAWVAAAIWCFNTIILWVEKKINS